MMHVQPTVKTNLTNMDIPETSILPSSFHKYSITTLRNHPTVNFKITKHAVLLFGNVRKSKLHYFSPKRDKINKQNMVLIRNYSQQLYFREGNTSTISRIRFTSSITVLSPTLLSNSATSPFTACAKWHNPEAVSLRNVILDYTTKSRNQNL